VYCERGTGQPLHRAAGNSGPTAGFCWPGALTGWNAAGLLLKNPTRENSQTRKAMTVALHTLIVKRARQDARQLQAELDRSGYVVTCEIVDTVAGFRAALGQSAWDVILSGFHLADFTVLEALDILDQHAPDTPLVLFSGTISEEMGVTAMRRGARDVIVPETIGRLGPVIAREMETARQRHAQKQVEKDAADYRRQLAELVKNLPVGVYRRTPGPDGKFIMANPKIAEIFGYASVAEFIQCDFADLFVERSDREQSYATIARDGQVAGEVLRLKKKDGTHLLGLVTAHVIRNAAGDIEFIDGIIEDYTLRKVAEEALIQSEKMNSMGGLAAGMAHEINNPLAGIMQNAAVLGLRLTRDNTPNAKAAQQAGTSLDAIRTYAENRGLFHLVKRIQDASTRAAGIVHNMLHFARKGTSRRTPNHLGQLLDQAVALAETDYDLKKKYDFRRIDIVREYEPQLPVVSCEESKLQQVFLNILSNGAEAMSAGDNTQKPRFVLRAFKKNAAVRVEIEDNGPGMNAETCKHVFEPFFTTKPPGEGTGLGLSVSHFIITDNHKGEIGVQTAPGRGATFFVQLPIHGNP
jgi:PAS domain S-box-containing protein